MKFSIKERLMMMELFPQQSNLINQVMVKDITEKTRITAVEIEKINYRQLKDKDGNPTGAVQWDDDKEFNKDLKLSEAEMAFLKEQVTRINKAEQITLDMVSLCQKIQDYQPKPPKEDKACESNT